MDGFMPRECAVCGRNKAAYSFARDSAECDVCKEFRLAEERQAEIDRKAREGSLRK